jgi:hypothetical protein
MFRERISPILPYSALGSPRLSIPPATLVPASLTRFFPLPERATPTGATPSSRSSGHSSGRIGRDTPTSYPYIANIGETGNRQGPGRSSSCIAPASLLPPNARRVVELYQLQEYPLRETAQILGISTAAVKNAHVPRKSRPASNAPVAECWHAHSG